MSTEKKLFWLALTAIFSMWIGLAAIIRFVEYLVK